MAAAKPDGHILVLGNTDLFRAKEKGLEIGFREHGLVSGNTGAGPVAVAAAGPWCRG